MRTRTHAHTHTHAHTQWCKCSMNAWAAHIEVSCFLFLTFLSEQRTTNRTKILSQTTLQVLSLFLAPFLSLAACLDVLRVFAEQGKLWHHDLLLHTPLLWVGNPAELGRHHQTTFTFNYQIPECKTLTILHSVCRKCRKREKVQIMYFTAFFHFKMHVSKNVSETNN